MVAPGDHLRLPGVIICCFVASLGPLNDISFVDRPAVTINAVGVASYVIITQPEVVMVDVAVNPDGSSFLDYVWIAVVEEPGTTMQRECLSGTKELLLFHRPHTMEYLTTDSCINGGIV